MSNMKTAVILNQSSRGLFIGKEYVPANGTGRVDAGNDFLQELLRRGTVVLLEGPGKSAPVVEEAVAPEPPVIEAEEAPQDESEVSVPAESSDTEDDAESEQPAKRRTTSSKTNRS